METTDQKPQEMTPEAILGAVLLVLGVLIFFHNLSIFSLGPILRYWPIGLIGGGTALLLQHFDSPRSS